MLFKNRVQNRKVNATQNQSGYTVLELLVVTLIIFILIVLLAWLKSSQA